MAKKHKKRQKISRRQRQAASAPRPAAPKPDQAAAPTVSTDATAPPEASSPAAPPTPSPAAPPPPAPREVKATFSTTRSRGADGIDAALTAIEYPAVRRDLRKLGLTMLFFFAVLAGLTYVGSSTDLINDVGHELFKLWR